jgi:hypothetical protein
LPDLDDIWVTVRDAMVSWHQGKLFIEHAVRINHDALHIMVGALLWLVIALLLRRRINSWYPWLWTAAIIAWNETVDLWTEHWPDPGHQYGEGVKDLIVTMFVPSLMMIAARTRPDLFRAGLRPRRGRRRKR